ncbi:MAG: hypothetical protein GXX79_16070 [Actinomycetales bacterium]|nr:hypothetical protein [Actinomycetales bacterium]
MDGERIRILAVRVEDVAVQVRRIATGLVGPAAGTGLRWESSGAGAFREALDAEVVAVRRGAVAVDDVAVALRAHAHALEAAVVRGLPAEVATRLDGVDRAVGRLVSGWPW